MRNEVKINCKTGNVSLMRPKIYSCGENKDAKKRIISYPTLVDTFKSDNLNIMHRVIGKFEEIMTINSA